MRAPLHAELRRTRGQKNTFQPGQRPESWPPRATKNGARSTCCLLRLGSCLLRLLLRLWLGSCLLRLLLRLRCWCLLAGLLLAGLRLVDCSNKAAGLSALARADCEPTRLKHDRNGQPSNGHHHTHACTCLPCVCKTKQQAAARISFINGMSKSRSHFAASASAEIDINVCTSFFFVAVPSSDVVPIEGLR